MKFVMVFVVYGMEARGLFIKVGDTVSASVLVWPLEWNNYPIRFIIFNLKKKKKKKKTARIHEYKKREDVSY